MSMEMDLGKREYFEVWKIPQSGGAYSPRVIAGLNTFEQVERYLAQGSDKDRCSLELVRVTIERERLLKGEEK